MDERDKVRSFFQKRVRKFDSYYSEDKSRLWRMLDYLFRRSMRRRFTRTLEEISLLNRPNVLDIGCGSGRYSVAIARMGASSVTGIDFAEHMLAKAREMSREHGVDKICTFVCGDFREYQFQDKFDATIAIGLFDYVQEPLPFLKKIRNLTTQKVIVSFPSRWHLRNVIRKVRLSFLGCPVYFYDQKQIESWLKAANFGRFRIENLGRDYLMVAEI